MFDEHLLVLSSRLRRAPDDGAAWVELARLAERADVVPAFALEPAAQALLRSLWAARPGRRELGRLVLPGLRLRPAALPDHACVEASPAWTSRAALDDDGGRYDPASGLPVLARRRFDGALLGLVAAGEEEGAGFVELRPDAEALAQALARALGADATLARGARALGAQLLEEPERARARRTWGPELRGEGPRLWHPLPPVGPWAGDSGPGGGRFVRAFRRRHFSLGEPPGGGP